MKFDMRSIFSWHSLHEELNNLMEHFVPRFNHTVFAALLVAVERSHFHPIHDCLDMAAPHKPP